MEEVLLLYCCAENFADPLENFACWTASGLLRWKLIMEAKAVHIYFP